MGGVVDLTFLSRGVMENLWQNAVLKQDVGEKKNEADLHALTRCGCLALCEVRKASSIPMY